MFFLAIQSSLPFRHIHYPVNPSSDICTETVLPSSEHYCIETVAQSGDNCINMVATSGDHCCTETSLLTCLGYLRRRTRRITNYE